MFNKAFVKQWLRTGKKNTDDIAEWHHSYFTQWVSFNYFYDFDFSRGSETSRIMRFAKKNLIKIHDLRKEDPDVMHALKALSKYPVIRMRSHSKSQKEYSINEESDIGEVFDYLYTVRCNLFHGSKGFLDKDKEVLKHSSAVLRYYLESLLNDERLFDQSKSKRGK